MTCLSSPCRSPVACSAFGFCRENNFASADTHPKGGDAVEQAAPFMSGAVPEGETPR